MNIIPQNIINIVEQMNNTRDSFWIRNNSCITLENIQKFCEVNIAAFHKKAELELKKENSHPAKIASRIGLAVVAILCIGLFAGVIIDPAQKNMIPAATEAK